jgi:hypothetical protein
MLLCKIDLIRIVLAENKDKNNKKIKEVFKIQFRIQQQVDLMAWQRFVGGQGLRNNLNYNSVPNVPAYTSVDTAFSTPGNKECRQPRLSVYIKLT